MNQLNQVVVNVDQLNQLVINVGPNANVNVNVSPNAKQRQQAPEVPDTSNDEEFARRLQEQPSSQSASPDKKGDPLGFGGYDDSEDAEQ